MPAQDSTNYSNAMKINWRKAMVEYLNRKVMLRKFLRKNRESWAGRFHEFPVYIRSANNTGSRGEGHALPVSDPDDYVMGQVLNTSHYVTVTITNQLVAQTKSEAGAWRKVRPEKMKNSAADARDNMNRMMWDGDNGILCECESVVDNGDGTHTVTIVGYGGAVDNDSGHAWDTVKHIKVNERLVWARFNAAAGGGFATAAPLGAGYGVVTAKNTNGAFADFTVRLDGGLAPVDNDVFVKGDGTLERTHSFGKESNGFMQLIDDANDSLHGINTATYTEWAAHVIGNTSSSPGSRRLKEDLMQQAVDRVDDLSSSTCDWMGGHTSTKRAYINMMKDKGGERYAPTKFKSGTNKKSMVFDGGNGPIHLHWDKDAPHRRMFAIATGDIEIMQLQDFMWDTTNGNTWKWVNGTDQATAFGKCYENLCTRNRAAAARIDDISVTGIAA